VQTKLDLPTVSHTEPWRNPATGLWESVAYIDLEKGWEAYSARAKKAADTLAQFVSGAKEENLDPFVRALRFGRAEAYAAGEEFAAARSVAQVLSPARAMELFERADRDRAALPREAADARRNASVYLECPLDLDGMIRNAVAAAFSEAGFPIATESRGAAAACVIRVHEGLMPRPAGTGAFYRSELSGEVTGLAGEPVFSFIARTELQSAIDPALARSRAYTALAAAAGESLQRRLRE
jgi:hypothetical protein